MIKEVKYKGVTRIPSDRNAFDGELEESVNITNVAGELRLYISPSVIGLIDGEIVFVHKNSGYEHFIYLKGSDIKAANYHNGAITDLGVITSIYGENYVKCEAVGNVIIILTSLGVKYSIWAKDAYRYIGNQLPFPVITFQMDKGEGDRTPFGVDVGSYGNDLAKLRSTISSGGHYRSSARAGTSPQSSATKQPFVSTDFENVIKANINSRLAELREAKVFIFPFFIRYALRLYDGSLIRHSQPFLMLPSKFIPFQAGLDETGNFARFLFVASNILYSHQSVSLSNYSDIIKSVDIFISEPIYTYGHDDYITGLFENPLSTSMPKYLFGGIYKSEGDILDMVKSTSNFYKVASLSISDLSSAKSNQKLKVDTVENVVFQERMTDDYLSHDKIASENSFVYNNKLHLCGITRVPFRGFAVSGGTCYYGVANGAAEIDIGSTPFIFYPGKCASMTLVTTQWIGEVPNYKVMTFSLDPHTLLNGSFYLNPNLEDITNTAPAYPFNFGGYLYAGDISENDKVYVSEHQNPFLFPVNSRITLPVRKIVGISSNTEAISQGQFGQFPLYIFTDDGVWALEIDAQGKYTARQPMSRDVCVNPNILQMDKYIGFISEKGLMIMSGADAECITDIIRENNIRASKIPVSSLLVATDSASFAQIYNTDNIEVFIRGCHMAYEYINGKGRIFLISKSYPYSYVFDIETKSWGKVQSNFKRVVNNYPDCYVQNENGEILNLSSLPVSGAQKKCMFVTRALSHSDLFSIARLAHRGIFKGVLNTVIYGSRNGVDYAPVASSKNILIPMRGTPYRYFKIAVVADLYPTDAISGCTIEISERYNNRLR